MNKKLVLFVNHLTMGNIGEVQDIIDTASAKDKDLLLAAVPAIASKPGLSQEARQCLENLMRRK